MTADKNAAPGITVTTLDHLRLTGVVEAFERRGQGELVEALAEELDRAEIVAPEAAPADLVTMHSRCRFASSSGEEREVTLVYPGEEDVAQGRISIVTPVGSALLGLRVGQSISFAGADGHSRALTLKAVTWQPEAEGVDVGRPGRS